MARVTYSSLKSGTVLKPRDELLLYGLKHVVSEKFGSDGYYLRCMDAGFLFDLYGMNLSERYDWAQKFGGKRSGNFTWFDKLEDLTRFVIDIYEKSPYKVGDKVKINEISGSEDDYPAGFNSGMQKCSGKVVTIKRVRLCTDDSIEAKPKYNGDNHWYDFEETCFTWSFAHFTRVVFSDEATITEEEKKPEVNDCPPKYKVGDRVRVKKRVGDGDDYPGDFVDRMLKYEGKVFTVKAVRERFFNEGKKFFDGDRTKYILALDDDCSWTWSSPMLEPADEDKMKVDHNNVRYSDLKSGYILQIGDKIKFLSENYFVGGNLIGNRYWIANLSGKDDIIFTALGIKDMNAYAAGFGLARKHEDFPEMISLKALTRLVISLFEKIEKGKKVPVDVTTEPDSQEHIHYEQVQASGSGSSPTSTDCEIRLPKSGKINTHIKL